MKKKMQIPQWFTLASTLAILIVVSSTSAKAETLREAMVSSYKSSPALAVERAKLRSTDEQIPQARAGWKPTISANAALGLDTGDPSFEKSIPGSTGKLGINLSQPLFRGYKIENGLKLANANVLAARQYLLAVEQDVLFQTVQAYMNVLRDQKVLALRREVVGALKQQLNGAKDRLAIGEVSTTDIAQARARVAAAESEVATTNAVLAASTANYKRVVGHKPDKLKMPNLPLLPRSLAEAQLQAGKINPNILAAALIEDASSYEVEIAKGDSLPELNLLGSARVEKFSETENQYRANAKIEAVLTIPLYQGGRNHSVVRQSQEIANQRKIEVVQAGRAVHESVETSWTGFEATRQNLKAGKTQISAAQVALQGIRQEYRVGSRTILDLLNAQGELLSAQISLVSSERNSVVASYQIIASIGQMTVTHLKLEADVYDAAGNLRTVEQLQ